MLALVCLKISEVAVAVLDLTHRGDFTYFLWVEMEDTGYVLSRELVIWIWNICVNSCVIVWFIDGDDTLEGSGNSRKWVQLEKVGYHGQVLENIFFLHFSCLSLLCIHQGVRNSFGPQVSATAIFCMIYKTMQSQNKPSKSVSQGKSPFV